MMMKYSEKVISEIKELFPDDKNIIYLAESGSVFLKICLQNESADTVSIDSVLSLPTLKKIQTTLELKKRKNNLYNQIVQEMGIK